jgi:hypothetical protein
MMRELTGKVIDLLEDSSLEAIKVSANRSPRFFMSVGWECNCLVGSPQQRAEVVPPVVTPH